MVFKDLIITPVYILIFSMIAYAIRPWVTNAQTKKYFLPALWVRMFGAIALGVIYQFYYGGGDTFNYFDHGSRWIYEAFWDDPFLGFKLLFEKGGDRVGETFQYTQHIWYYRDVNSFLIVRMVAFFDLFTFHTYSATALFFAVFSFSGLWAFFTVVCNKYPHQSKWIALSILFVPTVVFWGSGILKDTVTLGALGWLVFAAFNLIEFKKKNPVYGLVLIASAYLVYSIKVYILICFLPMTIVWIYWQNIKNIRNRLLRYIIAPALMIVFGGIAFLVAQAISSGDSRYELDTIAERAAITAYDIRYGWGALTARDGGYDLGELDGTWGSMIRLIPAGINVSLFRPYMWEVKNPLMLLSAMESLSILILSLWLFVYKKQWSNVFNDPFLVFCLLFALLFAFGVGVSTYNFGTLMRYKIPMIPFYLLALVLSGNKSLKIVKKAPF